MSTEIKYEIKPFQDSPGTPTVKVFLRDLRNLGNKKGDDFGWTLTDNLDGVDAGGANGGPQLPGAPNSAENRKALAAFAKRSKESSSLLYTHMLDPDVRVNYDAIRVGFPSVHAQAAAGVPHTGPFRSLGREQLQFFEAAYLPRILQVDIEQMDIVWLTLGIAKDIGIRMSSIQDAGEGGDVHAGGPRVHQAAGDRADGPPRGQQGDVRHGHEGGRVAAHPLLRAGDNVYQVGDHQAVRHDAPGADERDARRHLYEGGGPRDPHEDAQPDDEHLVGLQGQHRENDSSCQGVN